MFFGEVVEDLAGNTNKNVNFDFDLVLYISAVKNTLVEF